MQGGRERYYSETLALRLRAIALTRIAGSGPRGHNCRPLTLLRDSPGMAAISLRRILEVSSLLKEKGLQSKNYAYSHGLRPKGTYVEM